MALRAFSWNSTSLVVGRLIGAQSSSMMLGCGVSQSMSTAAEKETVSITFVTPKGERVPVRAIVGDSVLEAAHKNNIDLEGACEGSLACSTCHVILDARSYRKLEEPTDEENDMLDLAFALTDTSRLGCQIEVTKALEGMVCSLPAATANFYVDGHKPKPH